jgi:hypothetical protein
MITNNIGGGLGNQMFQYAVARCLSVKYNTKLALDVRFYINTPKSDTPREFLLNTFQIKADKIISKTNKVIKVVRFLSRLFLRPLNDDQQIYLFNFLLKIKLPVYLTRHFQREKYFLEIRDILLREFTLKQPLKSIPRELLIKIEDYKNSVSIHVRRTDALDFKNPYKGICNLDYYNKAIILLKKKISNPFFFVFSDDIEWCKENFNFSDPVCFVSGPDVKDYEELILMSRCKNNIIANSTFSWWGAWLNQNNDKIVIAPKQWLAGKTANDVEILPKAWVQI